VSSAQDRYFPSLTIFSLNIHKKILNEKSQNKQRKRRIGRPLLEMMETNLKGFLSKERKKRFKINTHNYPLYFFVFLFIAMCAAAIWTGTHISR
jgi:hypothetical protein